jgi:peptide/nickel transport system substrate-binding protein
MKFNFLFLLLSLSLIISSCGSDSTDTNDLKAIGGKIYGGEFSFMSPEKIESLLPISVSDIYSNRILSQIYEPLLRIDMKTMQVTPSLAESFKVSGDAKVFTFKLRKGILFHDDDCFSNNKERELTAEDVKFSLDLACSGHKKNEISYLLVDKITGAEKYNKISENSFPAGGVEGIKVIDPLTVQITLDEPFVGFDKILTHNSLGIISKKAYLKYGDDLKTHPVGTGAFTLSEMNKDKITLNRNESYWKKDEFGNQLPFIDKVVMTYSKDKRSELTAFNDKKIDIVLEIPVEEIQHVFGTLEDAQNGKTVKHKVETETSMVMTYMAFACESEEFKDEKVRKAFNLAVDRQEIIDLYIEGEGYAADHGFVPPMDNYPYKKVKGHDFNPELAKSLLAQAGYKSGADFPKLEIYVNTKEGSTIYKMMTGLVDNIKKNLGIELKIKLCTIQERNEAIKKGTAKLWRGGWLADYPDAENFLTLFYGKNISDNEMSVVNDFKFRNESFDGNFEKALKELNKEKRNSLLAKCDQITIDHAAVLPILTDDFIVMVNVRVRDFKTNAIQALDFSNIYIKDQR